MERDLYPPGQELTTKQAAEATGYNRRTIVAWVKKKILPATRRPGKRGHYRIVWQDLYEVLHTPANGQE